VPRDSAIHTDSKVAAVSHTSIEVLGARLGRRQYPITFVIRWLGRA
jgi:hypothetical protein